MKLITEVKSYKKFLTLQERFISSFNSDSLTDKRLYIINLRNFIGELRSLEINLDALEVLDVSGESLSIKSDIKTDIVKEDFMYIYGNISNLYT